MLETHNSIWEKIRDLVSALGRMIGNVRKIKGIELEGEFGDTSEGIMNVFGSTSLKSKEKLGRV